MHAFVHALHHVPSWLAILVLALFPLAEASTFVGILVPGETALVVGGVLAYDGALELSWMAVAGAVGAVAGDSIGYWIGRRWGDRLVRSRPARCIAQHRWDAARVHLHARGFAAVMFVRFAPALRALVPMLAGSARMPYARFFGANLLGGATWAVGSVLLGWAAGAAWERVHWVVVVVGLVIGTVCTVLFARRRHGKRR
jgi:undecaprenyl-diphosphatase